MEWGGGGGGGRQQSPFINHTANQKPQEKAQAQRGRLTVTNLTPFLNILSVVPPDTASMEVTWPVKEGQVTGQGGDFDRLQIVV